MARLGSRVGVMGATDAQTNDAYVQSSASPAGHWFDLSSTAFWVRAIFVLALLYLVFMFYGHGGRGTVI